MTPNNAPSTTICQTAAWPVMTKTARINACSAASPCVIAKMRWRLNLSASTPAKGTRKNTGISLANPTMPNNNSDLVKR